MVQAGVPGQVVLADIQGNGLGQARYRISIAVFCVIGALILGADGETGQRQEFDDVIAGVEVVKKVIAVNIRGGGRNRWIHAGGLVGGIEVYSNTRDSGAEFILDAVCVRVRTRRNRPG